MLNKQKKVAFYTLGCKLNFSETSTIARQFDELGFERVSSNSPADVFVINTCSVTEHADKKCRQAIKKFIKQSPNAFVAVVGCYAQLRPEDLAGIEGVDLVMGASDRGNIPLYMGDIHKNAKAKVYSCEIDAINDFFPAYSSGDRTRSFLKVQDGCDYHCTYCTIPNARGKSRNIPISNIVSQAQSIANQGIKEIILTGVNTGDFGRTTGESFIDLLKNLEKVEGIERYRISSIEPNLITDEVIAFVAASSKFLPHFHIPLQSGSNNVLRLMKRRYNRELFADKIRKVKQSIPNVFIGVDVIVGFPGETDNDFSDSYNLLSELKPSFLHVFPYSERPGTPAADFEGKVHSQTITQRAEKLQQLSHSLHSEFYIQNIGRKEKVLFEGANRKGIISGFTQNYTKVEVDYKKELVGKIVDVELLGISNTGNLTAKIINNE
ncbi:MAG: tRNA (N(6)-L-threonylcarbamoyladenosine(37)-C(2))-methylthiotransferase MtaB [Tenuifilaceae bacterium]|jgi:threonylcarbamoyladenosine tRNA methylthiotransferase MtaB|nr:tRNA (N(6)-L-threonylcarbamoyladenosine(37)-C(2))-methylthiotransferase MtaB [Tenuifilaceae bacterium]